MTKDDLPPPPPGAPIPWLKLALAACVVGVLGYGLMQLLHWLQNLVGGLNAIGGETQVSLLIIGVLLLYAILIACPFMPGIEVGVALLLLNGAAIAPLVYLATVAGLMTAFLVGRFVPLSWVHKVFYTLRLRKACTFVATMMTKSPRERLAEQRAMLPKWLGTLTVDYRYVAIGVLLNLPGTFAIGGGGGILLVAGLSRVFKGWVVLLTLLIATLPVPLTVWMMGG